MMKQRIDTFIEQNIFQSLDVSDFNEINHNDERIVISNIVYYFENNGYNVDELKKSLYNNQLFKYIENQYTESLYKDLKCQRDKKSKLIKRLISHKSEINDDILALIIDLQNNIFDKSIYKFGQKYNTIANKIGFKYLIEPLLNKQTSSKNAINSLVQPIMNAISKTNKNEHFSIYEKFIDNYKTYSSRIKDVNIYDNLYYKKIHKHLLDLFNQSCKIKPNLTSIIEISNTLRKYNFTDREKINLFFNVINKGEGIAKNILVTFKSESFSFTNNIEINSLQKELREIKVDATINHPIVKPFLVDTNISWVEISGEKKQKKISLSLVEQENKDIPWEELKNKKPYSISIIDNRKFLFGRNEILDELTENSLSKNIDSFILFGQKRVGKSSIVKSLKTELDKNDNLIVVYKSMGNLKAINPLDTFNHLGEYLCDEIIEELLLKNKNNHLVYEKISSIETPEFNGSLAPLESFIKKIRRQNRKLKFVFILDEFDELNQEFFKPGNIGETFSLNIGKGLNDYSYIGFILVGSENMQFLNWQGMRYNNFREKRVDTFNKSNEYHHFKKIVSEPVQPFIKFEEPAIEMIYDFSNGNPYFANLICEKAFNSAFKNRDSIIDKHEIETAINNFIDIEGKGRFEHFWSDGINTETTVNKDKTSDIRKRVLLAYNFSYNDIDDFPSKNSILKKIPKPKEYEISQLEFERIIKEFFNRDIFYEKNNKVEIKPKIFQEWLCKKGKNLLVEGVADLDNIIQEQELEKKLFVSDEEITNIIDKLKFKSKRLRINQIRDYLNQFGKNSIQRKGYNLLNHINYTSSYEIQTFFNEIRNDVFKKVERVIKEKSKKIKRENTSIYLFSKYFNENETIANSFKLFSKIDTRKKIINLKNEPDFYKKQNSNTIIIIEPIIENISFLKDELETFLMKITPKDELLISIVSIIVTKKAKIKLNKIIRKYPNLNVLFYSLKTIEDNELYPYIESTQFFEDSNEANMNYSSIRSIFPSTSKNHILVLFENYCPCRSLPILWKRTTDFKPLFYNEHHCCEKTNNAENEELRTRTYEANTQLSQSINSHLVNFLKQKTNNEDWLIEKLVPKDVIKKVYERWIDEKKEFKKESYLDFIDYKKIVKKHSQELLKIYNIDGNLNWFDKLNILRRDPAHPEKPVPRIEDVEYFENIRNIIIKRIKSS